MINTYIVIPFVNILILITALIPGNNFGITVIVFTILIKIVLWPFASKALHGQKAVQELQPEIQKLKKRYGNNKQELNKAVMEMYKEKEVNPMGSCFPTLVQLPFLFGMFYAFLKFRDPSFVNLADQGAGAQAFLYDSVKNLPSVTKFLSSNETINTMFLGTIDLAKPSVLMAALASVAQFAQTKMLTPAKNRDKAQEAMNKMTYFFPILTFVIYISLPAALPLYWLTSTLFSIFQQYIVMHRDINILEHLKKVTKKNNKGDK